MAHMQTIVREFFVDPEAVVVEGCGGLYIRFTGYHDNEDPRVIRAIGHWANGRRLNLSIRQKLALPRKCTRLDYAEARTRVTPYSTTTYAINGANIIERWCEVITTLEDLVFTQLMIEDTLGELQVETEKVLISIGLDAAALWHTSISRSQRVSSPIRTPSCNYPPSLPTVSMPVALLQRSWCCYPPAAC